MNCVRELCGFGPIPYGNSRVPNENNMDKHRLVLSGVLINDLIAIITINAE